jgi:hypothetical protein
MLVQAAGEEGRLAVITYKLLRALWAVHPDIEVRIRRGCIPAVTTVAVELIQNGERYVYAQNLLLAECDPLMLPSECDNLLRGARLIAARAERKEADHA